jgi:hypothetical protein
MSLVADRTGVRIPTYGHMKWNTNGTFGFEPSSVQSEGIFNYRLSDTLYFIIN